ncbi:MAG: AAA family ATPase [Promethearchaeota archaeon]
MLKSQSQFGYPRALYDPNYIPPKLLHRNKEITSLFNIFHSSLNPDDQFNINTYIYGIHGVGKTVFTKYFLKLLKSNIEEEFASIYLDLAIKPPKENLRLLVELYSHSFSNKFTFLQTSEKLWSFFHHLRSKTDTPLILILDNVDHLNQQLYEKIICYSNPLKLSTIATSQIPFITCKEKFNGIYKYLNPFKLEIYSSSALLDILSQRIDLAFPIKLNQTISKYIVDIVTQFDHYRPSTCINILRTIYQHLINGGDINIPFIRDTSIHLLEFPFQDDLNCLLQFDDSSIDLFYLPLMEKLAIYFKNEEKVYLNKSELFKLYKITCDEFLLPYNYDQFQKFIDKLVYNGFLYPSQFKSNNHETLFFMILNPFRLLEYLEIRFSNNSM